MSHLFVRITTANSAEETIRYDQFVKWLIKPDTEAMMASHIGLGLAGEVGELVDNIKREYHYNKPRTTESLANVFEELGDIMWYLTAACNHYGFNLQEVLQHNAEKLQKRYSELRYSDSDAIGRADKNGPT